MLQRLSIALAQVKAGSASKKLDELRQYIYTHIYIYIYIYIYSLYWEEQITKKVYNNIMNSIKL